MNRFNPASLAVDERLVMHCDGASIWRGRFVEEFALAETAVSEALAFLAELGGRNRRPKLPHLMGQRFETLNSIVSEGGPFAPEGHRVARILDEWSHLHQLRAYLCHGSGTVRLDQNGRWHMTLQVLNFRGREVERGIMEVTEDEAARYLDQLCSARIRLEGQLLGMFAAFRK